MGSRRQHFESSYVRRESNVPGLFDRRGDDQYGSAGGGGGYEYDDYSHSHGHNSDQQYDQDDRGYDRIPRDGGGQRSGSGGGGGASGGWRQRSPSPRYQSRK
jgi:hypothetical protein